MMKSLLLPYGKEKVELHVPEDRLRAVLTSAIHDYSPGKSQTELVRTALENPIGSPRLAELAEGKDNIVIIASDHTRPVPSRVIMPLMLEEIRRGNPGANITILIATGCHRGTTAQELRDKFGDEIADNEHIVVHDCDDENMLTNLGTLPSGGQCIVNRLACEADLLVAEGFIEPHFFAGYSGGRKAVLPGIAGRNTVLSNHCSEFIDSARSRTGILEGNMIHRDMVWAAREAKLAFIVNVVINSEKEAIYAAAGDMEEAHAAGCAFLSGLCRVKPAEADIVVTTNGGYPLDQNIYQAVKGMTAAEATVKEGGVIVMLAKSDDGHGGEAFYHQLADEPDIAVTKALFLSRGREETVADQWQSQIFIRVLERAKVVYVSDAPDDMVKALHMYPAKSADEALSLAEELLGDKNASVTVIPDGVSVMVTEEV